MKDLISYNAAYLLVIMKGELSRDSFTTAQRQRVKDQMHPRNTTDGCIVSMCHSRPTRNAHSASQPAWV